MSRDARYGRGKHYRDAYHHNADARYWCAVAEVARQMGAENPARTANEACRSKQGKRIVRRIAAVDRWEDRAIKLVRRLARKARP